VGAMLAGKNIVVTGGGNGIGRAVSLACAAAGARSLWRTTAYPWTDRTPSSKVANAVAEEITSAGGSALAMARDVSSFQAGAEIVGAAVEAWGSIDGVVCVAGNLRERMIFNMSEDEFDSVIAVHLKGHFNLYRHASAVMRKQDSGGSLVDLPRRHSSLNGAGELFGCQGRNYLPHRSAALSLHRYGIRATASLRWPRPGCPTRSPLRSRRASPPRSPDGHLPPL